MNEQNNAGQNVGTATTTPNTATSSVNGLNTQPRTYTQDQVTALMKKRVERSHNSFFKRYGVGNLQELDDLFTRSSKYNQLESDYNNIRMRNADLVQENAFLKNNINPDRYADIVAHFKGTGKEFSEQALIEALNTHPEWLKQTNTAPANQTTISSLGVERSGPQVENEKEIASKLFNVQL